MLRGPRCTIPRLRPLVRGLAKWAIYWRPSAALGVLPPPWPGAGDFYVTCAGGRNLRLGGLLGSGKTMKQARSDMEGVTIESLSIIAAMARALPKLYARSILDPRRLPLMEYLIQTVDSGVAEPLPLDRFFPEIA